MSELPGPSAARVVLDLRPLQPTGTPGATGALTDPLVWTGLAALSGALGNRADMLLTAATRRFAQRLVRRPGPGEPAELITDAELIADLDRLAIDEVPASARRLGYVTLLGHKLWIHQWMLIESDVAQTMVDGAHISADVRIHLNPSGAAGRSEVSFFTRPPSSDESSQQAVTSADERAPTVQDYELQLLLEDLQRRGRDAVPTQAEQDSFGLMAALTAAAEARAGGSDIEASSLAVDFRHWAPHWVVIVILEQSVFATVIFDREARYHDELVQVILHSAALRRALSSAPLGSGTFQLAYPGEQVTLTSDHRLAPQPPPAPPGPPPPPFAR
jgi:hypothetical protein